MFELDSDSIRRLLIERRFTLAEFARRAEITAVTARRLTRSGAMATAPTVGKVADALGVESSQILKEYNSDEALKKEL